MIALPARLLSTSSSIRVLCGQGCRGPLTLPLGSEGHFEAHIRVSATGSGVQTVRHTLPRNELPPAALPTDSYSLRNGQLMWLLALLHLESRRIGLVAFVNSTLQ